MSTRGSDRPDGARDADDASSGGGATVGERLTGERDARDPDGLLTVDQIAGGTHGASPEDGLRVPRDGRIEEPTADAAVDDAADEVPSGSRSGSESGD